MMDVLEHLLQPMEMLKRCLALLKPDGILLLQTPRYPEGKSFRRMQEENDPFLQQLKEEQHLYLFSRNSAKMLLRRVGAGSVEFEPAVFEHYDMLLAAGRGAARRTHRGAGDRRVLDCEAVAAACRWRCWTCRTRCGFCRPGLPNWKRKTGSRGGRIGARPFAAEPGISHDADDGALGVAPGGHRKEIGRRAGTSDTMHIAVNLRAFAKGKIGGMENYVRRVASAT